MTGIILTAGYVLMALVLDHSIPSSYILPKLTVLSLTVAVAGAMLAFRPAHRETRLDWALMLAALALALSFFFSIDRGLSLFGRDGSWSLGIWAMAIYASLFFLASASPISMTALSWLGAALSAHALLQRAGFDPTVSISHLPSGHRAIGTIGNPNELGAILAMILLSRNNMLHPCQLLILVGLWATGSRGAWLATFAGLAAMHFPRWSRWMAAASVFMLLWSGSSASDRARREVWRAAAVTTIRHLPLGAGPDTFLLSFRRYRRPEYNAALGTVAHVQANAHNDLLQASATTGFPGILAYLALWLALPPIPALVALFVNLKVNLFSFKVLALGALLAGTAMSRKAPGCPRRRPAPIPPRWTWLAIAALGATSLALCLRIYCSEASAAAGRYARAYDLWPKVDYIAGMVMQSEPGSAAAALRHADRHPNDSMAWYALALSQYRAGLPHHETTKRALELDPDFKPLRDLAGASVVGVR